MKNNLKYVTIFKIKLKEIKMTNKSINVNIWEQTDKIKAI